MEIMPTIKYIDIGELYLDPKNPRLGRHEIEKSLSQNDVLELMKDWSLDELAVSFLESGFWPQEALVVVREPLPFTTVPVLIVVEGNRRLAALRILLLSSAGAEKSAKWKEYLRATTPERLNELTKVPYIEIDVSRVE